MLLQRQRVTCGCFLLRTQADIAPLFVTFQSHRWSLRHEPHQCLRVRGGHRRRCPNWLALFDFVLVLCGRNPATLFVLFFVHASIQFTALFAGCSFVHAPLCGRAFVCGFVSQAATAKPCAARYLNQIDKAPCLADAGPELQEEIYLECDVS